MTLFTSKGFQIIWGIIFSVGLSVVFYKFNAQNDMILLVGAVFLVPSFIGLIIYKHVFWNEMSLSHISLSLLIAFSFLGAAVFTYSFGPIQVFPFRVMWVVVLALVVIMLIKDREKLTSAFHIPILFLFLLFWIVYGIFALTWSIELVEGIKDVIFLTTGVTIAFFVAVVYRRERNYLEFFTIWVVMGLIIALVGLINYRYQIHLPISRIYNGPSYQQSVPTSLFVNENDFASFLGISFFFFLSLFKNGGRNLYRLVGAGGAVASLLLILITESRANYLAVLFGLAFWFVFLLNRREKLIYTTIVLTCVPLLMVMFIDKVIVAWKMLRTQIDSLIIVEHSGSNSVDIRENLLKNVKVFIEDTFGFGVGPGNVEVYMKNSAVFDTHQNYNVHNWWAEILVHYGFLIFTGYILMFAFLFITLYRIFRIQVLEGQSIISEALICGLIAFVFSSISPNSFMALNYNWLFIAFVIAYVNFHFRDISKRRTL